MNVIDRLISFLAPQECLSCNSEDSVLCYECVSQIEDLASMCFICQRATPDFSPCVNHKSKFSPKNVWVKYEYNGSIKDYIWQYKFEHKRSASREIANLLDELVPYLGEVIVTYVPVAPRRLRSRGFDQVKLIAEEFAKKRQWGCYSLLCKNNNITQHALKREDRIKQIKNSYLPVNEYLIKGKNILLIDDVITTGATMAECARQLYKAGAKTVYGAALAKTLR